MHSDLSHGEVPTVLNCAMTAPVEFQDAEGFQLHAALSRELHSKDANDQQRPPSHKKVELVGVGTGALQSSTLRPIELVEATLQLRASEINPSDPLSKARYIARNEGLRSMYRGLWINIHSAAPALGVEFWCYERSKRWLSPGHKNGEEGMRAILRAGNLHGVGSWVCCSPFAVVKCRHQAHSAPLPGQSPLKHLHIVDCFHRSVREEGTRLLFLGLGTAVAGL